jgi:copper ion binding protein
MAFVLLASAAIGAEANQYVVGVDGMTWGSCASSVRATLSKLENVDQVKVEVDAKTATITMKKGTLTQDVVAAAFKGSRYSVSSFKPIVSYPRTYTLAVSGMTRGSECVKRVHEALSKLDGVEKVNVDFDKKTAYVSMVLGSVLNKDVAAAALKKNGEYGITGFVENKPVPKKSGPNVVTVGVSGMTWGGCAGSVRAALSKIEGVKEVTIDLKKNIAIVTLKEKAAISKEAVTAALSSTKFKVTSYEKNKGADSKAMQ